MFEAQRLREQLAAAQERADGLSVRLESEKQQGASLRQQEQQVGLALLVETIMVHKLCSSYPGSTSGCLDDFCRLSRNNL